MSPSKKRLIITIAILFLLFMAAWTRDRTRRFIGHHDWDMILKIDTARNYQRYGLLDHRLKQITNLLPAAPEEWQVYQRQPPGIMVFTYFGLELFGSTEFATRLLPLGTSLLTLALFFALSRRLYQAEIALLGVFFLGFTPLMIYYSAKIGHEQYMLPLILIVLLFYRQFSRQPASWVAGLLFAGAFLGFFISWSWYFFLGFLGLHVLKYYGWQGVRRYWFVWAGAVMGVIGYFALQAAQTPDFMTNLKDAFLNRTANENGTDQTITPLLWLVAVPPRLLWLPTPVVTFFALIALWKHPWNADRALMAIPALTAIFYCLTFWQATFYHDYLIYYLIPPLCLWASVGYYKILYLYGRRVRPMWQRIMWFLLLLFLIGSYRWTASLFTIDVIPERYKWGVMAGDATQPGEVVVTNLVDNGPHLAHYANRDLVFQITPERVNSPTRPEAWGFYIFCHDGDAPDWVQAYRYTVYETPPCFMIDLK